jgi:subtilisin family serine protease
VTVYVIDTGILTSHTQFGGRAAVAYDALGGNGQDCNGHGTHVAGTVGGSTYGIAKGVALRAVRVLNCSGSGTNSGVIAGMDWVRTNHVSRSVANMSLGGGYSSSVNTAATNLVNSGVFLAVAAGNSNADACNYSPASASGTCTVAATTSSDARASYSNYGSCVDIYAPGSSITSAWYTSTTAINTISGTSMASPHVAGVGALYKATYGDASASTIISWLKSNATANVVSGNVGSTPNQLLYKSSL